MSIKLAAKLISLVKHIKDYKFFSPGIEINKCYIKIQIKVSVHLNNKFNKTKTMSVCLYE